MIRKEQLDNWFTYHKPTLEQNQKYLAIRNAGHYFATLVVANTPEGADQSDAIRKIREAVMTANQALACEEPRDFCSSLPAAMVGADVVMPSYQALEAELKNAYDQIRELKSR